jgi:hypothetical protein
VRRCEVESLRNVAHHVPFQVGTTERHTNQARQTDVSVSLHRLVSILLNCLQRPKTDLLTSYRTAEKQTPHKQTVAQNRCGMNATEPMSRHSCVHPSVCGIIVACASRTSLGQPRTCRFPRDHPPKHPRVRNVSFERLKHGHLATVLSLPHRILRRLLPIAGFTTSVLRPCKEPC